MEPAWSAKNRVFDVCHKAYPTGKIDLGKLKAALASSSRSLVNESCAPLGWTALECAVRCKEPQLEAVRILLQARANPFGNAGKSFHNSALGLAINNGNLEQLEVLLGGLRDLAAWESLVACLCQPPDGLSNRYGLAATHIEVDGRKAVHNPVVCKACASETSLVQEHNITFEDGIQAIAFANTIKVLPVVLGNVKSELLASGFACGCSEDILANLRSLEKGKYLQPMGPAELQVVRDLRQVSPNDTRSKNHVGMATVFSQEPIQLKCGRVERVDGGRVYI